ncbi:Katanin p80 WD40 repeat-containing subunit B1 [Toxocara canis]|uniref:Katanin p80 WD40 repeat-containing subunit B1 n=1 Tax=Toxocara canis TaxID=6265 RepID=A0A0B2V514_TOXCA|nr:Katanin p80 WD40 repeat-containing subunit B1 [Toxocara canis]
MVLLTLIHWLNHTYTVGIMCGALTADVDTEIQAVLVEHIKYAYGLSQMQTVFEKTVSTGLASVGTVGVRSKRIFVGSPLTQYSFGDEEERVLNGTTTSVVECVALGHDERSLAYSTSTVVKLVDLNTGRELRTLVGHNGRVNAVVQSNRSIYVWASVSSDCTVTLWDTRQHPANVLVRRLDRPANCARFSPNDAFIALGSDHLYMMDPRIRDMRSLSSSSQVLHVCFHPSEYLLAAASEDRLVRFWDIDSEECVSQSEPTDGIPRAIAFHNDGSALFTLTDRRCGAICWEPFDILGQCSVPQCEHSLAMAVADSEVFVLSRSLSLNLLSLQSTSVLALLNEQPDSKGEPLVPVKQEDTTTELGETPALEGAGETAMEEPSEEDVFMPTRTLPRTPPPQPFTLPPSEETFIVSMVNTSQSQPRPTTLKARRSEVNLKNGTKNTSASGSRMRRSVASNKSIGGAVLACTSSAPDVRAVSQKKRSDREENSRRRAVADEVDTGATERCNDENWLLEEISNGHTNVEMALTQRRLSLDALRQCWRTRGVDAALAEAARIGETALLAELLAALNHSPTTWNLSLCCAVLSHIGVLVASKHEHFVEVALTALRTAITGFGSVIRMGAQQPSHIGVDVTAEERHSKCVKCVQQLTEMRVKASLLCDRMNARHAREFNALMQIFDDTISPL